VRVPAYLLIYNPDRWRKTREEWQEDIAQLERLGPEGFARVAKPSWSLGTNYRRVRRGDRLFLMRVGSEPRGIFASGHATSDPYEDLHWDGKEGHTAWYVDIRWDALRNPYDAGTMLLREELAFVSTEQRWSPYASGEEIKEEAAEELEAAWQRLDGVSEGSKVAPEEDESFRPVREGGIKQTTGSRYERNPKARRLYIESHGPRRGKRGGRGRKAR
jgi:5-methylcytosine-specific restriction protein A